MDLSTFYVTCCHQQCSIYTDKKDHKLSTKAQTLISIMKITEEVCIPLFGTSAPIFCTFCTDKSVLVKRLSDESLLRQYG